MMKFISMRCAGILTAAAMALSLASCGAVQTQSADTAQTTTAAVTETSAQTGNTQTDTSSTQTPQRRMGEMKQNGTPGRITSIDGTTVTVELFSMDRGGAPNGTPPEGNATDGQTPPALPEGNATDGQTPPELPDGAAPEGQTPPELPEGNAPEGEAAQSSDSSTDAVSQATEQKGRPGGRNDSLPSGGQTVTIDLSLITKDGSAVTAEELKQGDLLILTLDDSGSATAAQVMDGNMGPRGQGNGPQGDAGDQNRKQRQGADTQSGTDTQTGAVTGQGGNA